MNVPQMDDHGDARSQQSLDSYSCYSLPSEYFGHPNQRTGQTFELEEVVRPRHIAHLLVRPPQITHQVARPPQISPEISKPPHIAPQAVTVNEETKPPHIAPQAVTVSGESKPPQIAPQAVSVTEEEGVLSRKLTARRSFPLVAQEKPGHKKLPLIPLSEPTKCEGHSSQGQTCQPLAPRNEASSQQEGSLHRVCSFEIFGQLRPEVPPKHDASPQRDHSIRRAGSFEIFGLSRPEVSALLEAAKESKDRLELKDGGKSSTELGQAAICHRECPFQPVLNPVS